MAEAESRLLRHWETMERVRQYRNIYKVTKEQELFQWLGNIAWGESADIQKLIRGEALDAEPSPIQSLFLKCYDIYKARFDDQESLRKNNAHVTRLVRSLSSLPCLESLNLEDVHSHKMIMRRTPQTQLGANYLDPEDFADTGYDRNILQNFDTAIRQSSWCGSFHTNGSRRPNGSRNITTTPPTEMLGDLCSQLGEKGFRPKNIKISLKPPPNMRVLTLSSSQQDNMKLLVSQASSLTFCSDFSVRPHELQENSKNEMIALSSVTKAFFSAPKLESLDIHFAGYPGNGSRPTISLSEPSFRYGMAKTGKFRSRISTYDNR